MADPKSAEELVREAHRQVLICAAKYATECRAQPMNGGHQQAQLDEAHAAIDAAVEAARREGLQSALSAGAALHLKSAAIEAAFRRGARKAAGRMHAMCCDCALQGERVDDHNGPWTDPRCLSMRAKYADPAPQEEKPHDHGTD